MKKNRTLSQPLRILGKILLCIAGIYLLSLLLLHKENNPEVSVPVVRLYENVYAEGIVSGNLTFVKEGKEFSLELAVADLEPDLSDRVIGQIADVIVTDNRITKLVVKEKKIHGKVLALWEGAVWIEEYGILNLEREYACYHLSDLGNEGSVKDLTIGYDFADFVVDNDQICGIIIKEDLPFMDQIRVLIKTSEYESLYHEQLQVTSDSDFIVRPLSGEDGLQEEYSAGEVVTLNREMYSEENPGLIVMPTTLTGTLSALNISRNLGTPRYSGCLEIHFCDEGMLVINELPLEEYLYKVVPSEMPASYPEEALCAQAICARTYAYKHMQKAGYREYGAHLDDSTTYQVYNNIEEQVQSSKAIDKTKGQLLFAPSGDLAGTYYYSTSCGTGTGAHIWKTSEAMTLDYLKPRLLSSAAMQACITGLEYTDADLQVEENFRQFISKKNEDDFEKDISWYRWTYEVKELQTDVLYEKMKKVVDAQVEPFSKVLDLKITKRLPGGVADELLITTDSGSYQVISEHNIRSVLCNGTSKVVKQDGKESTMPSLLPSGFFTLETGKVNQDVVGYFLVGGGFGHGVGMSQNCAKEMALQGYDFREILEFFYENCEIKQID